MKRFIILFIICFGGAFDIGASQFEKAVWSEWPHALRQTIADTGREIAENRDRIKKNDFEVSRGLWQYEMAFGDLFSADLRRITPRGVWIDVGAGSAKAQIELLEKTQVGPVCVAVSVQKPADQLLDRAIQRWGVLFQYREGRPIEEYAPDTFPRADIITDVYGAASYTPHLDVVLQQYGRILKKSGRLYIVLLLTKILDSEEHDDDAHSPASQQVQAWLSSIEGLKTLKVNVYQSGVLLAVSLEKIADEVRVPPLRLVSFKDDKPPYRVYRRMPGEGPVE